MQRLELNVFNHTVCKERTSSCLLPLFPYKRQSQILVFSNETPLVLLKNTQVSPNSIDITHTDVSFIPTNCSLLLFFEKSEKVS